MKKETGRGYVRNLVRERDGNQCQTCKRKHKKGERRFDVHHLRGWCGKKSRGYDRVSDMHLLTTLCHSCHMRHHVTPFQRRKTGLGILNKKERDIKRLRKQGLTYDEIGRKFGVSSAAIYYKIRPQKRGK